MDSSEILEEIASNNKIIEYLVKLFGGKMEIDIIKMIAYEMDFNLEACTNHLVELTKGIPAENVNDESEVKSSQKLVYPEHIERIIRDSKRGIKIFVLMRGLPGSGKSYLAERIVKEALGVKDVSQYILSTDDYFYNHGVYEYNRSKISEAHNWNQTRARHMIEMQASPIIIDNTNTEMWEMECYCRMAVEGSYIIEIVEPLTSWAFNCRELSRRNKHNVPKDTIMVMLDRYAKDVTVPKLFQQYNISYKNKLPPQPRAFPPIIKQEKLSPIASCSRAVVDGMKSWDVVNKSFETELVRKRPSNETGTNTTYSDLQNQFDTSCSVLRTNGNFVNNGTLPAKYPKERFYDKGTMTDEENEFTEEKWENLSGLFQGTIPLEYIKDVYEKCQRNMDWTVELLLADKKEFLENYTAPIKEPKIETPKDSSDEDVIIIDEVKKPKIDPLEMKELIQHIESNIVINPAHYSPHMLKVKKIEPAQEIKAEPIEIKAEPMEIPAEPSTSKAISIDSDSDFDNLDDIIEVCDDDHDLIEINLGDYFVSQLESKFGDVDLQYPKGFQPVIEIPRALGRQLHALYLESIFKQMETQEEFLQEMIKEDAEFAKTLQNEDQVVEVPDLKQIMVEQKEISKQEQINQKWKVMTPDDIAYRMTKQKLINSFPTVSSDTLIEVLTAHDNCYQDTVNSLLESGVEEAVDPNGQLREAPLSEDTLQEMREAHSATLQENTDVTSANELRVIATASRKRRQDLLNKAKFYYHRQMHDVAVFYSDLASKQTLLYEKYNNLAVEQVLRESFDRLQNFDTIDLHHLHVTEALNALDIFLDRNIMLLQGDPNKAQECLMIITGRGKNSPGGIPRIRPAVEKRLEARGLRCSQLNPGLLRIKILKNSKMTNQLVQ